MNDNLEIVDRKVPLGRNISLTDVDGHQGVFTPITIIHHMLLATQLWDITRQMYWTVNQDSGYGF